MSLRHRWPSRVCGGMEPGYRKAIFLTKATLHSSFKRLELNSGRRLLIGPLSGPERAQKAKASTS